MAELGHNYNIQCMKLLHELKETFPFVPDDTVRQCMKKHRNEKENCIKELTEEEQNIKQNRHQAARSRNKGNYPPSRRSSTASFINFFQTERSDSSFGISNLAKSRTATPRCDSASVTSASDDGLAMQSPTWDVQTPTLLDQSPISGQSDICDAIASSSNSDSGMTTSYLSSLIHDFHDNTVTTEDSYSDNSKTIESSSEGRVDSENNIREVKHAATAAGENVMRRKKKSKLRKGIIPRPLSLSQASFTDSIPSVVLTPESPPKDSPFSHRKVQTLYRPDENRIVKAHIVTECGETNSIDKQVSRVIGSNNNNNNDAVIICGCDDTVTKTRIDILPGMEPISLPFPSISTPQGKITASVNKSTTSMTQGTVHFLRDIGNGSISVATTTYCGVQQSLLSSSLSGDVRTDNPRKTTTVIYTEQSRPIICENPFRKVFAKRKQFYQSKEKRGDISPETSAKKLIWRHNNHECDRRRNSLQPQPNIPDKSPKIPKWFTVNANIQPFDPFTISHNITTPPDSPGESTRKSDIERKCSSVNLTLVNETDSPPPVELLADGTGLRYSSKVDLDGTEASLEVNVKRDGSTITTKRTGAGQDNSSNQISVQLLEGGHRVDIQQSHTCCPPPSVPTVSSPARPTTLNIPAMAFPVGTRPRSLYQSRGASPKPNQTRYSSLPNLWAGGTGVETPVDPAGRGYTQHPKDEAKRLAYTRALLTHQMEQMLKLESTIRQDKECLIELRQEVCALEAHWEQQVLKTRSKQHCISHSDLKGLQEDINQLKIECENTTKKINHLTIEAPPASPSPSSVASPSTSLPPTNSSVGSSSEGVSWSCDSCTFHNHPSLDECEMCYMPRIEMGTNRSRRHSPGPCFCHPQDQQKFHSYPQISPLRPDRALVSKSGGKVFNPPTFGVVSNDFDLPPAKLGPTSQYPGPVSEYYRSDSDTITKGSDSNASCDSVSAQPPSLNLNSI